MKNLFSVLLKAGLCAALVFSLVALTTVKPVAAAEPIKVGFVLSISGPYGFIGTPQKEVVDAIVLDVNKKGGINGRPLEALIEDDKSVPTNAVIAGTKLIKDKKVCAIIGASSSDASAAMRPTAEQEKVPFIVTAPLPNLNQKWVFIVGPGDIKGASHLLEYAINGLGAKKIALLSETGVYGKVGADTILQEIKKYPGTSIIIHEKIEVTDTNLIPQLTKIKAANADLLLFYGTANPAAIAAKNYKQLGMTVPFLGSNAITIPSFVKMAGDIAEEMKWIFFTQPFAVAEKMKPDNPFSKTLYDPLKKMMQDTYGPSKVPNLFHASTYDGLQGLIAAIKLAKSDDRAAIRDALEKVNAPGFLGGFAPTPQDHYAAPKDPMIPVVMKGGDWAPYEK
jgi:branched-chain amino acid transport system substrate-binding protein